MCLLFELGAFSGLDMKIHSQVQQRFIEYLLCAMLGPRDTIMNNNKTLLHSEFFHLCGRKG